MARLAIIGGTGFETPGPWAADWQARQVRTRFGPVELLVGQVEGEAVVFLSRHGPQHRLPPHRIPYRANIEALRLLGVRRVAATAAVGALREDLRPGQVVVLDQFIDLTRQRDLTWFDGDEVAHTDFTEPYCSELRRALWECACEQGLDVRDGGCYVGVDGPRYETAAEVRAWRLLGGDVVGMTGLPEAVLAREAGLCYGVLAVVTNPGAGLAASPLSHQEVSAAMERLRLPVARALVSALLRLPREPGCRCSGAGRGGDGG